ncbi:MULTISPECIES: bifunctional UDP-N-acetylglucosamine diphosphorylase/glucosamine-1-phosphate N-acetyltransferase GlmU [Atopobiaceae]|uniref:Bifunctional protein GlmU n=1 Tax=Parafannyhessea umbonata TaxID=604330 RepID=A0A1H9PKG4_9ACTN|nr:MULTISPECIES: bifunctional UDP-N-acetylglucosamine diphosphorylase/glucosamine-1-phosphate N-acetyltransferase GlmU [Atopobiaceae]SEH51309.1 UDP-N-acetylglucosamine pyrophosphorylase /glucosamine-1-phosphate N-acetyltransferase [Parafannyhessea umbonata]SER48698.1 UDP-N-acetylglucosamine pyrophosphorylase /glucosamine-1-phosphate N-acetyltransferase [Parafannyhessea umbonata]SJZ75166.1 bifunctional UDP-N-acetylglucosamine pyrophosphorylase / Glucosamine-1-phosphate N-acetyltransferase [Olsene
MPVTAIVLAAGEGTRMKSRHPKVMHRMLGKPLAWWAVNSARKAGIERIVLVVGNGSDEVRSYFSADKDVEFVEQTERLGTGHAVRVVRDALGGFGGPVVVLSGDSPLVRPETIEALVAKSTSEHNACTVLTMTPPDVTGYGRVQTDESDAVQGIIEHKDCTPEQREKLLECNSGVYCFCGRRLSQNIDKVGNDNVQGEYYLTDMVGIYVGMGEPVACVHCDDYSELLGVNSRIQLAQATKIMQRRINEGLMARGVTMLDPDQVWVGPEATIGQDCVLLPQTFVWGKTSVGCDCTIGPNSRLENATVGNGCTVDETIIVDSSIDDDVNCGPRAYLRGGTHFCKGAKAGTHVELKNSTVGEGSKVPHLSYIGDTTMGAGVNIGGGSITCNYDGVHKNKTFIGDGAFIGSDTMMVAPVSIGADAITGASSCITKDVPAGALAIERSDEKIIAGYAAKRRERLEKGNK